MKKATLIIGIIVALAATAWAEDKPKPTKQELQAEYNNINLQYQLNQERSKVIAYVSIHAPARGATFQGLHVLSPIVLFQSTPLREGRQGRYARQFTSMMFQSTPLREGRRTHSMSRDLMRGRFQSTPLREGRPSRVSPARVF